MDRKSTKDPFLMGQSTISMAMFNSYLMLFLCLPEGIYIYITGLFHWTLLDGFNEKSSQETMVFQK
jgi:hypothetical protein